MWTNIVGGTMSRFHLVVNKEWPEFTRVKFDTSYHGMYVWSMLRYAATLFYGSMIGTIFFILPRRVFGVTGRREHKTRERLFITILRSTTTGVLRWAFITRQYEFLITPRQQMIGTRHTLPDDKGKNRNRNLFWDDRYDRRPPFTNTVESHKLQIRYPAARVHSVLRQLTWSCGSMMRGHRAEFVTIAPFSIET